MKKFFHCDNFYTFGNGYSHFTWVWTEQGCFERLQLGDYIDRDLISKFEKETGIKVNYELYDTNESMLAKLETGGTYYDLIFPSDYVIEEMIARNAGKNRSQQYSKLSIYRKPV